MHRLLGAVLILCSGTFLCCMPLFRLFFKIRGLNEYIRGLECLKSLFVTEGTSIPVLTEKLGQRYGGIYAYVTRQVKEDGAAAFREAWSSYIRQDCQELGETAKVSLLELGASLGRYTADEQQAAMERTLMVLREEKSYAQTRLRESLRLTVGGGITVSLMLIVVLL